MQFRVSWNQLQQNLQSLMIPWVVPCRRVRIAITTSANISSLSPVWNPRAVIPAIPISYLLSCCCCCWSLLYSAILRSRADSLRSHVILREWLVFYGAFLDIHRSGVLTALVPHETAAVSARFVYRPDNHAPRHLMQSKVHACLAVTSHLRFWQNDRDLLRATAVTTGWNGYQNKSQRHIKSTLETEKKISRLPCRDSNPRPFNHESGALTTELPTLPFFYWHSDLLIILSSHFSVHSPGIFPFSTTPSSSSLNVL